MNDQKSLEEDYSRYSREIALLEQVHTALGAASRLDEFYTISASLLVDANTFGFSRCFLLRYDEKTRMFTGRLALGAQSEEEHAAFRAILDQETERLRQQVEKIRTGDGNPFDPPSIYDLRYHSLWIRLLQGQHEGTGMNAAFEKLIVERDALPANHVLELAAVNHLAASYDQEQFSYEGLEPFVQSPVLAGRLFTKRGLHGVMLCDRAFDAGMVDTEALYHFQWLLNHAAVALDNVELVSELTATTQRFQDVDRLKTNFLSIVSHELRTPLTSIVGFVHLLAEEKVGPVTASQADLLRRVGQHAAHLHNMVNDLLEIAEVEAGGMINVALRPVDPLEALLAVVTKVESRRGSRKIEINTQEQSRPPFILCDTTALERICFHLLDNAAKFTGQDGQVGVSFQEDGQRLDIKIWDTGIGISEPHLQQIFDHFYQVDSRLERAFGGMGIGLTMVKLLLEATGGTIRVESTPGAGSSFTLTFALAQAVPAE